MTKRARLAVEGKTWDATPQKADATQADWKNRAELLQEDIESFHLAMDGLRVPRFDERGAAFSMYGRALHLVDKDGVVELVKRNLALNQPSPAQSPEQAEPAAPAGRPIETAPKDARPLLLKLPPIGGWAAGWWRCSWSFVCEGWCLHTPHLINGKAVTLVGIGEPTEWAPLP